MLPVTGTSGEAAAILRASASCDNYNYYRSSPLLCQCLDRVLGRSDRWHAACRAPAQGAVLQAGGPSVVSSHQNRPLVEYSSPDDWKRPLRGLAGTDKVSVALGKFDAMHIGHRKLASTAAEQGGQPWLVSFSGMADVLGWPKRPPLVADADRAAVLASWAPYCGGIAPCQRFIPFGEVRNLSPEDFVRVLAQDLQVSGVVVGEGFRFGYKAAGNTKVLQELGQAHGLDVSVVSLVASGCSKGPEMVSSSAVRAALAGGRMDDVERCLGRPYRLLVKPSQPLPSSFSRLDLSASECLNQLPGDGRYSCRVIVSPAGPGVTEMDVAKVLEAEVEISGSSMHLHFSPAAALPRYESVIICID